MNKEFVASLVEDFGFKKLSAKRLDELYLMAVACDFLWSSVQWIKNIQSVGGKVA